MRGAPGTPHLCGVPGAQQTFVRSTAPAPELWWFVSGRRSKRHVSHVVCTHGVLYGSARVRSCLSFLGRAQSHMNVGEHEGQAYVGSLQGICVVAREHTLCV